MFICLPPVNVCFLSKKCAFYIASSGRQLPVTVALAPPRALDASANAGEAQAVLFVALDIPGGASWQCFEERHL